MAKNRKVKRSAETVWLNMVSKCASLRSAAHVQLRNAVETPVCGMKHATTMNQKVEKWSHSLRTSRYVGQRPGRYPQGTAESFVKWSSAGLLHSPAWESAVKQVVSELVGRDPLSRGGHTHT